MINTPWLSIERGPLPLIVSIPHAGTEIPAAYEEPLVSLWLARKDADWWVDKLYGFATGLGATVVHTAISRTIIDVNRDPSGISLYPGQATTELCPLKTFDGEPLYRKGRAPDVGEIVARRELYFDPYHAALESEISHLGKLHRRIVLFEAHSIRSRIPRLFEGELPTFNIGTNGGQSCALKLTHDVESICASSSLSWITNGRFKGGYTTRHYGLPEAGIHALQLELAMCSYMDEPEKINEANWPASYEPATAEPLRASLIAIVQACLRFAT